MPRPLLTTRFVPAVSAILVLSAPFLVAARLATAGPSGDAAPAGDTAPVSSPAAEAAPSPTGPVIDEFPPDQEVCYGHAYSRGHLSAHPRQKVTEIYLTRLLSQDPQSEMAPKTREQMVAENVQAERDSRYPGLPTGRANLEVYVRFNDKPGMFSAYVNCYRRAGGFECGVDCDGGTFAATMEGKTLIMKPRGLRVQSGCSSDDESGPEVTIDQYDPKGLRLEPLAIADCERARSAHRPEWVEKGEALRQRFAGNPAICFRRVYDEGHLTAHPRQLVKSVTLQALAPTAEAEHPFRVRFQQRNGTVTDKTVQCAEQSYSFHCAADSGSFKLTRGPGRSVTLREAYYEEGTIAELLGLKKVEDDHTFRLDQVNPSECR